MRDRRFSIRCLMIVATALCIVPLSQARAQSAPHVITVKIVDKSGGQFAFEPSTFGAQHGDTVRFLETSGAPHNVHFKTTPKGAKLGSATTGPYLAAPNATYDVIIDSRFVDGTYGLICDPHESVGMRATMTVGPPTK